MTKIFIIGSLAQMDNIHEVHEMFYKLGVVRSARPYEQMGFFDIVKLSYEYIEWCDWLVVVTKPDMTIGKGDTYELEFAKQLNKKILYYVPTK